MKTKIKRPLNMYEIELRIEDSKATLYKCGVYNLIYDTITCPAVECGMCEWNLRKFLQYRMK